MGGTRAGHGFSRALLSRELWGSSGLAESRETRAWCPIWHGQRSLLALLLLPQLFSPFPREPERLLQWCSVYRVLPGLYLAWKHGGGCLACGFPCGTKLPRGPTVTLSALFLIAQAKGKQKNTGIFFFYFFNYFFSTGCDCLARRAVQFKPNGCYSGLQGCLAGSTWGLALEHSSHPSVRPWSCLQPPPAWRPLAVLLWLSWTGRDPAPLAG